MESPNDDEPASAAASTTFGKEYSFEVKKPVGAMSISPCGRDVVLASRQGLHVIDLDSPYRQPRHLPHHTPWEVADVQWSPFPARDYWVVSTSNQKALVWNLMMNDAGSAVEHYLHAHTRAITDINFSAHNPDILATCAVDSFVHCWDLRHPAKPALSFADWFAGATQVKWNRQDPHIIASAHDKFLRIWDDRNGAHPLRSIEAHDTKIYGLDWNRVKTTSLVTCSLDKTIKFWDYSIDTRKPKRVIKTSFPIWRARHTPFGYGVLAMPQRDDYNVYLYKRRADAPEQDLSIPVKAFPGHEGQVKEFLWRCRGNVDETGIDHREFQLVTWGADKKLRLHRMDETTLAAVGYATGMKVDAKLHLTRSNAAYKTFRDSQNKISLETVKSSSSLQHPLKEIALFEPIKAGLSLRGRSAGITGGFLNSRNSTQNKSAHRNELDPISWMKGVKTGKRDVNLTQESNADLTTDHRMHRASEDFETLGEEIVHVGTKFSKVKFEKAEDKQRYVKFGMRGIWDKNGSSTYLECRIDFPEDYPFGSTPNLTIEKTARLDRDVLSKLEKDVQAIGNAYLKFKRNSLEAIIRYLHGDQSLEEALNWTRQDIDASIAEFPTVDESSSDEDDLGIVGQDHDAEFGLANSGFLETTNVNAYMPLAKACAAVWAQNGTLVCFFPPKIDAPRLGPSLGFSGPDEIFRNSRKRRADELSKGHVSHGSRSTMHSGPSSDHFDSTSESETSESEQSSSASSVSSRDRPMKDVANFAQRFYSRDNFDFGSYSADKAFDGTLKSTGSESVLHSRMPRSKSIITLHDLKDLIPSKEALAKEYVLSGPKACQSNFLVAQKHGYEDLAEVWQLLGLLLHATDRSRGSHTSSQQSFYGLPVSKATESQPQITRSVQPGESVLHLSNFVDWSYHPLGRDMLIEQIFDYYARIADEQMLAVMSCILAERDAVLAKSQPLPDGLPQKYKFSSSTPQLQHHEYFPIFKKPSSVSPEDKSSKTKSSSLRSSLRPKTDSNSLSSSLGTVTVDSGSLGSTGTEVVVNRSFEGRNSTSKLSSSPEWIRPLHKSSSTLASAIMTSIPRPFSLTTSAASSPPTLSLVKKKFSPMGSLTATNNDWAHGNSNASATNDSPSTSSRNANERVRFDRDVSASKGPGIMTVALRSQNKLELANEHQGALLNPERSAFYGLWRASYAELLHSWDLLLARAELLKFNGIQDPTDGESAHRSSSLTIGLGDTIPSDDRNMSHIMPASHCSFCGSVKRSEDTKIACRGCAKPQTTICVLCNFTIPGRSSPCFVCGHVLHVGCRESWQQISPALACPTGCGCFCTSPTLPPSGIVTSYAETVPAFTSPVSSRFASTYLTSTHSRGSSAGASASTARGFNNLDPYNQHSHSPSGHRNPTHPSTGTHTPHGAHHQPTPQIAYAALQSLAAQDRFRIDLSAASNSTAHQSEKDAANTKASKIRQSKSLMFVAGLGSVVVNTQADAKRNTKPGQSARSASGATAPANASSATVRARGGRQGGRRHNVEAGTTTKGRPANAGIPVSTGLAGVPGQQRHGSQQEELAFELGFDDEDDSDVESRVW